ncbi:MAG: hypothetical protein HY259_03360 [Chloroflexi bacterium]|nr:hypothetical protein [Chloroflexota bacterium]
MAEEKTKADEMRWEEHLRVGLHGLRDELREEFGMRAGLQDFRHHGRAALKEMLLAWRGLIDGAITHIDEAEKPSAQRATKIAIE